MPRVSEPFQPFQVKYPSGACVVPLGLLTDSTVSAQAKVVYIRLTRYAGNDGVCRPSQTALMAELNACERSIRYSIRELEASDYLRCRRRGWGRSQEYELLWHPRFEKIKISQSGKPDVTDRQDSAGQVDANNQEFVDVQGLLFHDQHDSAGVQFKSASDRQDSAGQKTLPYRQDSAGHTGKILPVSEKGVLKGVLRASRSDRAGRQAVTLLLSENQPAASLPAQDATLVSNLNTRMEALESRVASMNQIHERLPGVLERLIPQATSQPIPEVVPALLPPVATAPTQIPPRPEVAAYLNTFTRTMAEPPPSSVLAQVCTNLAGAGLEQFQTHVERRINGGLKPTSWTMFALWARDVGLAKQAWDDAPPPARKPVMSAAERAAEMWQWAEERINTRNRERAARAAAAGRTG